jgi:hypothetical protein
MSKGPSTYALKGGAPRYSEEYENFHLASQYGSKTASELDHWRKAHSKKFLLPLTPLQATSLHYAHKHGNARQTAWARTDGIIEIN